MWLSHKVDLSKVRHVRPSLALSLSPSAEGSRGPGTYQAVIQNSGLSDLVTTGSHSILDRRERGGKRKAKEAWRL